MNVSTSQGSSLPARAEEFVAGVLKLAPRLAAFDCDGTLWRIDAGEGFFYWEMDRGLLGEDVVRWAKPRYEEYRAGRVDEVTMCGEMVTMNAGVPWETLQSAAAEYFAEHVVRWIFPEMMELTRRLKEAGCELWAISSTNEWVIQAAAPLFGFAPERVVAASVACEDGRATSRLLQVPTDESKASLIRELLPRTPDAVFGNSMHDLAMMELGRHAFAVNPNPDLENIARERGWTVYQP